MLLLLAKEPDGLQRLRDDRCKCPGLTTNAGRTRVASCDVPRFEGRAMGPRQFALAEHACDLTERRIPALLDTLAAAYAEAGDFPRAIVAAEEALNRARSSGDNDAVKLSESILASLRENVPYREEPE